jgi:hypothetical protein
MKLIDFLQVADSTTFCVREADGNVRVMGDETDLVNMLSDKWLGGIVRNFAAGKDGKVTVWVELEAGKDVD